GPVQGVHGGLAPWERTLHARPDVLRRRRRPVLDPEPHGGRARLRQPGTRARAVVARLRRRPAGRPARGVPQPGEGRVGGAAGARPRGSPPRGRTWREWL